jgi:hypothetical protein
MQSSDYVFRKGPSRHDKPQLPGPAILSKIAAAISWPLPEATAQVQLPSSLADCWHVGCTRWVAVRLHARQAAGRQLRRRKPLWAASPDKSAAGWFDCLASAEPHRFLANGGRSLTGFPQSWPASINGTGGQRNRWATEPVGNGTGGLTPTARRRKTVELGKREPMATPAEQDEGLRCQED